MTPYIKKIVELHKIHKAIEEKDCCNGGGNNNSGGNSDIDYEAIYQFYKNITIETILEGQNIDNFIIPEHFTDIKEGTGDSDEYENKYGIWKGDAGKNGIILFTYFSIAISPFDTISIYFGKYDYTGVDDI